MRITFEPTVNNWPKITLETRDDDLGIGEVAELLRSLLLAWGFDPANVEDILPKV